MIRGFVLASSAPNSHEAALEKIRQHHPQPIRRVYTTTGRYNLVLDLEARSVEEMTNFVFSTLHEMKDIMKTRVVFPARVLDATGTEVNE